MKNLSVLLVIGVILFGSCTAQNANAQSANDAQRIVGTWRGVDTDGVTFIFTFNSNGTYTHSYIYNNETVERSNGNYFLSGSSLLFKENNSRVDSFAIAGYYLSSNGNVLSIINLSGINITNSKTRLWLNKQ